MKVILKFALPAPGQSVVGFQLPMNAKPIAADALGETAFLYVWAGTNRTITKERFFAVVKDGWELPMDAEYICSYLDHNGIWHVIEKKSGGLH